MSNTELNIFAANVKSRVELETKSNSDSNKVKYVAALALTVSADNVFKLMSASNVSPTFAVNHRISTAPIDAKALKRVDNVLKFAVNRTDKLESCANEIVRTVINFKNAKMNITLQDMTDCLTFKFKSKDKNKQALLFMKSDEMKDPKRHSIMTERALSALNILSINPQNSKEYVINDNAILKALEARFAPTSA